MRTTLLVVLIGLVAGCGKPAEESRVQPMPDDKAPMDPIKVENQRKPPPAQVKAKDGDSPAVERTTLDALLTNAPKTPLKLTTFSFGGIDLTAELPESASVESKTTNYSVSAKIAFEPGSVVILDLYVHDLSQTIQHWVRNPGSGYQVVKIWRGPEFQLVETSESGERRFYVEMLPNAGPVGMRAYVEGEGLHHQSGLVTRAQAMRIFQSLRTIALKKPLATDPVEQIEALGGTVRRNGAGRVDIVELEGYAKLGCTGFALPLLKGVPEVRSVHLHMFRARQDDFGILAGLPNLQRLTLSLTDVGDAGLIHIAKCRQLQFLEIKSGDVTLAGLKVLRGLSSLTTLRLSVTAESVNATDLSVLPTLPSLKELELRDAKLTDEGLKPLGQIASLERLSLNGNAEVGDPGLAHLEGLPQLKYLNLSGTKVTDSAITAFKQKKPGVEIEK